MWDFFINLFFGFWSIFPSFLHGKLLFLLIWELNIYWKTEVFLPLCFLALYSFTPATLFSFFSFFPLFLFLYASSFLLPPFFGSFSFSNCLMFIRNIAKMYKVFLQLFLKIRKLKIAFLTSSFSFLPPPTSPTTYSSSSSHTSPITLPPPFPLFRLLPRFPLSHSLILLFFLYFHSFKNQKKFF